VRSTFLPATEITGARTLAKVSGAVFRFSAIGPGTGFECALVSRDQPKPEFKSCRTPKSYRHLKPGRYTFEVAASAPTGLDPTPARRAFGLAPNTRITRAKVDPPSGRRSSGSRPPARRMSSNADFGDATQPARRGSRIAADGRPTDT